MAELFGIETLKKTAKLVVTLGTKVEEALSDDGKVKLMEALGIAISAFPGAFELAQNAGQLKLEFNDLSDEERNELVAYVLEEFDLEADKIEAVIEAGFELLVAIEKLIDKVKEAKEVPEDGDPEEEVTE